MKYLIIVAMLIPTIAVAQSCYSKKDDFTGKEVRMGTTSLIVHSHPGSPALSFTKNGDDLSIAFTFLADLKPDVFDTQKMLLLVKFSNGEIKKYPADRNTKIIEQHVGSIVGFQGAVSKDDLIYFRTYPVAMMRLSYTGDEGVGYDQQVSSWASLKIMKSINCVIDPE